MLGAEVSVLESRCCNLDAEVWVQGLLNYVGLGCEVWELRSRCLGLGVLESGGPRGYG